MRLGLAIAIIAALGARAAADGFVVAPTIGASAQHFGQPPDDEGPQWLVGPMVGVFVGARTHGAIVGVAFEHTQAIIHAEEGYATDWEVRYRVERALVRVGYELDAGACTITPSLAFGFLDSDVPFYTAEVMGVTGSAGVAIDWRISPSLAAGANLSLELGEAWPKDLTIRTYGATLGAHVRFTP